METVHVKIVKARDLKSADANGFSDPYVLLKREGDKKQKTRIIKKNLNPNWNEAFVLKGAKGQLELNVMDWDRVGSDDFLGSVQIDLSSLPKNKPKEEWMKLTGPASAKVTGEIHVLLYCSTNNSQPNLQPTLVTKGAAQLYVTVESGKDLEAKDASGTSDPYCKVKFGGAKVRTKTVMKTLDPEWTDEEFYFEVLPSQLKEDLIWDWDFIGTDDRMGQCVIPLQSLKSGEEVRKSFPLVPQKKEKCKGSLTLRLEYVSAEHAEKNYKIAEAHLTELSELIQAKDTVLVACLCSVYQSDEVSKILISVFEANHQAPRLLNQLLYREIKKTEQETTLFRTDSMATKTTRNFLKLIATQYLRDILHPFVQRVLADDQGFEVDPNKEKSESKINENAQKLTVLCQDVFNAFAGSLDAIPAGVRQQLGLLKMLVKQKFPDSAIKSVGAFFFLRFAGPAIFTPAHFPSTEPSVVCAFNPVLFSLQETPETGRNARKSARPRPISLSVPYRLVWAIGSLRDVKVYASDFPLPIARIESVHCHNIHDLTWSADGSSLFMCSSDGYISSVHFGPGELGQAVDQQTVGSMERRHAVVREREQEVAEQVRRETEKRREKEEMVALEAAAAAKRKALEPEVVALTSMPASIESTKPMSTCNAAELENLRANPEPDAVQGPITDGTNTGPKNEAPKKRRITPM